MNVRNLLSSSIKNQQSFDLPSYYFFHYIRNEKNVKEKHNLEPIVPFVSESSLVKMRWKEARVERVREAGEQPYLFLAWQNVPRVQAS